MFGEVNGFTITPFILSIATPVVLVAIFVFAGRSMARTLLILSVISLSLVVLDALFFVYAVVNGLYGRFYNLTLVNMLDTIRVVLLGIAGLPTLAVWILALYDTARTRRWGWLAAVLLMGLMQYSTGGYGRGTEISFMGWILYLDLVSRHGVVLNVVFTALTHATAVIPLLYALRYRPDTGVQAAGETVPLSPPPASADA